MPGREVDPRAIYTQVIWEGLYRSGSWQFDAQVRGKSAWIKEIERERERERKKKVRESLEQHWRTEVITRRRQTNRPAQEYLRGIKGLHDEDYDFLLRKCSTMIRSKWQPHIFAYENKLPFSLKIKYTDKTKFLNFQIRWMKFYSPPGYEISKYFSCKFHDREVKKIPVTGFENLKISFKQWTFFHSHTFLKKKYFLSESLNWKSNQFQKRWLRPERT